MKIAVTYNDGEVFQHFGHTEQIKMYEVEDNKILCGSPLDNKMIMNIFIDYIKN